MQERQVGKIPWRKEWLPIAVLLPGEFRGQRSLEGYSPWGCKELDMTKLRLTQHCDQEQGFPGGSDGKDRHTMQEIWVQSLGWEDRLKEGMATRSSIFAWRIPTDRGAWEATVHGVAKSWTRLSDKGECDPRLHSNSCFRCLCSACGDVEGSF